MAIIKNSNRTNSNRVEAIVAEDTGEYGLAVGPEGSFHKSQLQAKAKKWTFLFAKDKDSVVNLINVLEYIYQSDLSNEIIGEVMQGAEAFKGQFDEWIASKAAINNKK